MPGPQQRAHGIRSSNKGQGHSVLVNPGNSSLSRNSSISRNTSLSRQGSMNRTTTSSPRGGSIGGGFGSSSNRNVSYSPSTSNSRTSSSSSSSSNSNNNIQQQHSTVEKENTGAREPRASQPNTTQILTQLQSAIERLSNLEEEHKLTRLELTAAKVYL